MSPISLLRGSVDIIFHGESDFEGPRRWKPPGTPVVAFQNCLRFANPASAIRESRSRTGVSSYIGMLFDIANGNLSIIMSKASLYVHNCSKSIKNGAQIDPKWAPNRSQIGFRRGFWARTDGEELFTWRQIVWEPILGPTWSDLGAILGSFWEPFWVIFGVKF